MLRFVRLAIVALFISFTPAFADDKPLTRIALGSCADQDKPLPIYDKIVELKPELLILLGDNIYADLDKSRKVTTEIIQEKYDILAKLPGWQKLKATCPMVVTWDDHDYGKNDAGVEWPLKEDSQKIFLDFFGIPKDSPRRTQKGVYNSAIFGPPGKRVQVIALDMRYHRTKLNRAEKPLAGTRIVPYLPTTDADATFLGAEQWMWLEEQLRQPADLRLIGSGLQVVSDEHPFEKWTNVPAEREKLYKVIRNTGATGVVILSGDRHLGELSLDTSSVGYPLYDLTSSGFNQASKEWRAPEKNSHRVAAMPYGDNFGFITLDWDAPSPIVGLQLRDVTGEIVLKQTFPISLLKPDPKEADKPKVPEGVLTPLEAIKKVGEEVTVQMEVVAGRAVSGGKRILLNSDKDFNSDKNFTVVVNEKAMTGKFEKATYDTFKGKTIRAKGKVTLFKDAPQIQIDDAKLLEIVDEKEKKAP